MRAVFVAALIGTAFATAAVAQPKAAAAPACPNVQVTSPAEATGGTAFAFVANVAAGDPNVTPTYNWAISAGTIDSGQGTPVIQVIGTKGEFITATVDVGGYDRACATAMSSSTQVTN